MDLVSLQNQTRIWLGQVLGTRLDADLHISDLLQDGEILFQVSKVVWDLFSTQCMELECGPFVYKRSRGRYRPYCNVDSFLKVCKNLGMNGIDLFSPSDVVEKRDIRKVCICIRALAKKARSKELSIPDFDVVIYSVAMPTVKVGEIRRSLESSSPCTTPSSAKRKLSLKSTLDDSICEESDEPESRSNFDLDDAEGGSRSDQGKISEDEEIEICSSSTTNTSSILGTVSDASLIGDEMEKLHTILCVSDTLEACDNEIPPCEDKGILTVSYIQGATCDEFEDRLVSSTLKNEKQDETRQTLDLDIPVKHALDSSGRKGGRMTILKTIVKGTAIAGVIFLLSNFRKSAGTNANQMKQPSAAPVTKESKFTSKKQQIVSRKGIYPVEKLKF